MNEKLLDLLLEYIDERIDEKIINHGLKRSGDHGVTCKPDAREDARRMLDQWLQLHLGSYDVE